MPCPPNYCEPVIRDATQAEVRAVQLEVLRPNGPLPGDADPPAGCLHVAAVVAGKVVGACSVCPARWSHPDLMELPAPQWQLRSMAVLPHYRGGTGTALLAAAVRRAERGGAASLWANARVAALGLYQRAGWTVVGPQWDKAGIGPHHWIVFTIGSGPDCAQIALPGNG